MREHKLRDILGELEVPVIHRTHKGWLIAQCPFAPFRHERGTDRSPSFNVKVDDRGFSGFNCFTCHEKGNIFDLVKRLEYFREVKYGNLATRALTWETPESFEEWDTPRGEFTPEPEPLVKAVYVGMFPLAWEEPAARAYLQSRGVTERTAVMLEMQFDPEEQRIIVPIYDRQGNLYGFNGRSILPEEQFPYARYKKSRDYAGLEKARNILGFQHAKRGKPVWIVEGLFAVAHLYDIGFDQFVTPVASMGSQLSEYQRDMLTDLGEPVYLGYDNDAAGEDGLFGPWNPKEQRFEGGGAIDLLKEHLPTFVPIYPYGINDPDYLSLNDAVGMLQGAQFAV